MKMTTNRFAIFLGLKWQEFCAAWIENAWLITFCCCAIALLCLLGWIQIMSATSAIAAAILVFIQCVAVGLSIIFFLGLGVALIWSFISFLRDNWIKAGKIQEQRKKGLASD